MAGFLEKKLTQITGAPAGMRQPAGFDQSIPMQKDYGAMLTQSPDALFAQLLQQQDEEAAAQQAALEEQLIKRQGEAKGNIDLAPAAQLIDSSFGTNISPAFAAEQKAQMAREADLADLELKLAASGSTKGSAEEKLINYMQNKNKQGGIDDRYVLNKGLGVADSLQTDIEKNITNPLNEDFEGMQGVESGFARGDYQTVMSNLSNFSRAVAGQKGVLTDKDIQLVFPESVQTGVAKFFTKFGNGEIKVDATVQRKLLELIDVAKKKLHDKALKQIATKRGLYAARPELRQLGVDTTVNALLDATANSPALSYFGGYNKDVIKNIEEEGQLTKDRIQGEAKSEIAKRAGSKKPALSASEAEELKAFEAKYGAK
jgi:hypothetical protein